MYTSLIVLFSDRVMLKVLLISLLCFSKFDVTFKINIGSKFNDDFKVGLVLEGREEHNDCF
jgi:hypothetical protein